MTEEIMPGLYRIEIPLPGIPLKSLNSYLIKTAERFLIIDTGLNRKECLQAMYESLDELSGGPKTVRALGRLSSHSGRIQGALITI